MIPSVVEEHGQEAALLWKQRTAASVSRKHDLRALAAIDGRLEAHLAGLAVADPDVWRTCAEVLPLDRREHVFVVSSLALAVGAHERLAALLDEVGVDAGASRGVASALGFAPAAEVGSVIEAFLDAGPPELTRVGVAGAAMHRLDPGPALSQAVESPHLDLRARALRAVGELRRVDLLPQLRSQLRATDPELRFWAAWSGALLGDAEAITLLEQAAGEGGPRAAQAMELAVRARRGAQGHALLEYVASRDGGERTALVGAAALGDGHAVERLVAALRSPAHSRIAARGLAVVTGVFVRGTAPEGFEPPDPDPDEDLDWPDADALTLALRAHSSVPGVRHLCGAPIGEATALGVLADGDQALRHSAALELAMLQPSSPLLEVRGPGQRQKVTRRTG